VKTIHGLAKKEKTMWISSCTCKEILRCVSSLMGLPHNTCAQPPQQPKVGIRTQDNFSRSLVSVAKLSSRKPSELVWLGWAPSSEEVPMAGRHHLHNVLVVDTIVFGFAVNLI
jgi:hypothetical protein